MVAGDIGTLAALTENCHQVKRINVGGLHQRPGRSERLYRGLVWLAKMDLVRIAPPETRLPLTPYEP